MQWWVAYAALWYTESRQCNAEEVAFMDIMSPYSRMLPWQVFSWLSTSSRLCFDRKHQEINKHISPFHSDRPRCSKRQPFHSFNFAVTHTWTILICCFHFFYVLWYLCSYSGSLACFWTSVSPNRPAFSIQLSFRSLSISQLLSV